MCYMLLLGTDATDDLSLRNTPLVRFTTELPGLPEELLLQFPHQWFVAGPESCSCGFRHLNFSSISLGFGAPESWYPEDAENLEATLQFVHVVHSLLASGHRVECIDTWSHGSSEATLEGDIVVDFSDIPDTAFRFFENHRFVFVGRT